MSGLGAATQRCVTVNSVLKYKQGGKGLGCGWVVAAHTSSRSWLGWLGWLQHTWQQRQQQKCDDSQSASEPASHHVTDWLAIACADMMALLVDGTSLNAG
jgi:hypothetical protein